MKPRNASQSFLGKYSEQTLNRLRVAVIGYGGGGSHLCQQLAHIGIGEIISADDALTKHRNLNRLVGATAKDAEIKTPKVNIAKRLVRGVSPTTNLLAFQSKWQLVADSLKSCHVIFGAVDSYRDRDELERFSRRHLIPYIDIGMDILQYQNGYAIGGQVILSMPGQLCLRCFGFLTEARLAEEAKNYDQAGARPQVIWPNGVLASLAIGLFMQIVTPWNDRPLTSSYIEFDGNNNTAQVSNRQQAAQKHNFTCQHFSAHFVGDPFLDGPSKLN